MLDVDAKLEEGVLLADVSELVALGMLDELKELSSEDREALAVAEIPQFFIASDSASIELYTANQESNLAATAGDRSVVKGLKLTV